MIKNPNFAACPVIIIIAGFALSNIKFHILLPPQWSDNNTYKYQVRGGDSNIFYRDVWSQLGVNNLPIMVQAYFVKINPYW